MGFLRTLLATTLAAAVVSTQAAKIEYDQVKPFPETEATTEEFKLALNFKPQLYISRGCHPYPAVDEEGNVSGGKGTKLLTGGDTCAGSHYGSQVYGRTAFYKNSWAFMYAWYFPRVGMKRHSWEHAIVWLDSDNATIAGVSTTRSAVFFKYFKYSPVKNQWIDGDSVQLRYWSSGVGHNVKPTKRQGQYQDLIMWNEMPEVAQIALSSADFGLEWRRSDRVPLADDYFLKNLKKAYPW